MEPIIIDKQLYPDEDYEPLKKTVEDNSFIKGIGNNRVLEAHRIKKYCAKQEKCKDCIFYDKDESQPTCVLTYRSPEHWPLEHLSQLNQI